MSFVFNTLITWWQKYLFLISEWYEVQSLYILLFLFFIFIIIIYLYVSTFSLTCEHDK